MAKARWGARALLSLNGPVSSLPFLEEELGRVGPFACTLAVDGGARHLEALGMMPDLLVGDLDSLPGSLARRLEAAGIPREVHPPQKDQTDFELALAELGHQGFTGTLYVIGGLGARPDHSFSALMVGSALHRMGIEPTFLDREYRVRFTRRSLTFQRGPYNRISLVPVTRLVTGITTRGLRYGMVEGELLRASGRGVSNELLGDRGRVRIRRGLLMVMETTEPLAAEGIPPGDR